MLDVQVRVRIESAAIKFQSTQSVRKGQINTGTQSHTVLDLTQYNKVLKRDINTRKIDFLLHMLLCVSIMYIVVSGLCSLNIG